MSVVMTTFPGAYQWQCVYVTAIFLCQVTLALTVPSHSSWHFLSHKHAEHTADVPVTVTTSRSVKDRRRRDVGIVSNSLPDKLTLTFTIGSDDIKINLGKNKFVHTSPPLFLMRNGKMVLEGVYDTQAGISSDLNNVAFYQDAQTQAAIMARRRPNGRNYQLTGSYVHDGQEFSIQPITDGETDDVDHKISRVLSQNNQLNDVFTFDASPMAAGGEKGVQQSNSSGSNNSMINNDSYLNITSDGIHDCSSHMNMGCINSSINEVEHNDIVSNKSSEGIRHDWISRKYVRTVPGEMDVFTTEGRQESVTLRQGEREGRRRRRRRQTELYVVELAMVIDYGVYRVWYEGVTDLEGELKRRETLRRIRQFYSFVLNGIDLRYSSVRGLADFHIDVTWAAIIIFDNLLEDYWANMEKPPRSSRDRVESSAALEAFRAWTEGLGEGLPKCDHVMLFTGHNLTYGGSVSNAGLAYLGSACNPEYFFSIVEEHFDFRDVAIAAHELGHSLGARHDMDGNVCLSQDRYIMTSRFQYPNERKARNPWLFSKCTVQYFKDFIQDLDRNGTNCLLVQSTSPDKEVQQFLLSLPGDVYRGDKFCRIGDGIGSYICREQHVSDYRSICYGGVFCYIPTDRACSPRLPPDGFSCGNKKWCMNGSCELSDLAPVTQGDDCPFGDAPDMPGGLACAERVMTSRYECYKDTFRARCCASCLRHRRNLPGCEYGDQFDLCRKEECVTYDLEYARENCCDTCDELLFTLPVTMETTAVTSAPSLLPGKPENKSEDVTSRSEDSAAGRGNQMTPNGRSVQTEGGRRGRMREMGDGNGRRFKPRRRDSESEDSEESDELLSRDYHHGDTGNIRYTTRMTTTTNHGSLSMMRNLLGDMKSSRISTRSQRMRLLVHILDRIRRENLGDLLPEINLNSISARPEEIIP